MIRTDWIWIDLSPWTELVRRGRDMSRCGAKNAMDDCRACRIRRRQDGQKCDRASVLMPCPGGGAGACHVSRGLSGVPPPLETKASVSMKSRTSHSAETTQRDEPRFLAKRFLAKRPQDAAAFDMSPSFLAWRLDSVMERAWWQQQGGTPYAHAIAGRLQRRSTVCRKRWCDLE